MKSFLPILLFCLIMLVGCSPVEQEAQSPDLTREFYQLRVYTFADVEQEAMTDSYLRDAYLPGLDKLGYGEVGVFKRRITDSDTIRQTFVLVPGESLEQFALLEDALNQDQSYVSAAAEYLTAPHDRPPYQRIETSFMHAFLDMPKMTTPQLTNAHQDRIYELRSYEASNERYYRSKVDMFNAGGEVKLFQKLAFNPVFFGDVVAGAKMPNLVYMTTFPNQAFRDSMWNVFVDSPEWKGMVDLPQYANTVSHADIYLLYPTEYSDY